MSDLDATAVKLPSTNPIVFERKGETFRATLGTVLAEGGGGVVQHARRLDAPRGEPEAFVAKWAKPGAERGLELERQICEQIDHPNLVRYLGTARAPNLGTLIGFEWLGGNPLLLLNGARSRPRFRDPGTTYYPLPPGRALELAFDLLLALEHLHSRGYIHGDVKLSNLLVRVPPVVADGRAGGVLPSVAQGSFEGVLIDLGSVRTLEFLERLSRGEADLQLVPSITPLYAPPEALFERGELGGRKIFSPAMDVYAFGLVFYALLTGRVPYDDRKRPDDLKNAEVVQELKVQEVRGAIQPMSFRALDRIPLHDVAFEGSATKGWPAFRVAAEHVLRRCTDPDPAKRMDAPTARAFFEEEFRLRPTGTSGPRPWTQFTFQMRPRTNRMMGELAPRGGIRILEAPDGSLRVEEGSSRAPSPSETRSFSGDGVTINFRSTDQGPKTTRSTLRRAMPKPPKGMIYLADVLREFRSGRPLPVKAPVLLTRAGMGPRDLIQCLVFSLGSVGAHIQIRDDETVSESIRVGIGRAEGNDIVVTDSSVSKRHCNVELKPEGWAVVDLGSANGTTVDGDPVPKNRPRILLKGASTIGLGPDTLFVYCQESELADYLTKALDVWTQAHGEKEATRRTPLPMPRPSAAADADRMKAAATGSQTVVSDGAPPGPRPSPAPPPAELEADKGSGPIPSGPTEPTRSVPRPPSLKDLVTKRFVPPTRSDRDLAATLAPKLLAHAERGEDVEFEVVLEGARVESSKDVDEVLALIKNEPADVVSVEVLVEGQRWILYKR